MKSKIESVKEIADNIYPSIICIIESKIDKHAKCKLAGFCDPIELRRNNKQGGGIWITYKESVKRKITVLEIGDEELEQVWLNIKTGIRHLILGVVYGKQESRVKTDNIQSFIDRIDYYALKAKNESKAFMVVWDFNVKVGEKIKGNHKEISIGGKFRNKMIKKRQLLLLNRIATTDSDDNGKKSVLDYILLNQICYNKIQNMIIDEERNFGLERISSSGIKESDQNAMILDLNLTLEDSSVNNLQDKKSFQWRLTDDSLREFRKCTKGLVLDCRNKDIDKIYNTWDDNVTNLMATCFDKKVKQRTKDQIPKCKEYKQLQMKKRYLKIQVAKSVNDCNKVKTDIMKIKIKLLNRKIIELNDRKMPEKLNDNIRKIKQFNVNSSEVFKVRQNILGSPKTEVPTSMIDDNGKEITNATDIVKEHKNYFKNVLTNRNPGENYKQRIKNIKRLFTLITNRQDKAIILQMPHLQWGNYRKYLKI